MGDVHFLSALGAERKVADSEQSASTVERRWRATPLVPRYELAEGGRGHRPLAKRRRPLIVRLGLGPAGQRHVRPNRTTETTLGVHPTGTTKLAR
jgi:hypothetical protein